MKHKAFPNGSLIKSDSGRWYLKLEGKAIRFYTSHKSDALSKAKSYHSPEEMKAKGMRWVTIRGAHVLIQGLEGGGYAVVGGAGGKLNHLKIDNILSNEEYSKRRKERLQAMKEKNAKEDEKYEAGEMTEVEVDAYRRKKSEVKKNKGRIKRMKEYRQEIKRQYVDKVMDVVKAKTINEFIGENRVKEIEERVMGEFEAKFGEGSGKGKGKGGKGDSEFDPSRFKKSILQRTDELKRMEATRKVRTLENQAMTAVTRDFFREGTDVVSRTTDEYMEGGPADGGLSDDQAMELVKVKKKLKAAVKNADKTLTETGALKVGMVFAGEPIDMDMSEIENDIKETIETAQNVELYDKVNAHMDRIGKYIDNGASRALNGMLADVYGGGSYFTEDLVKNLGVEALARTIAEKLEREGKVGKVLPALKAYSDKIRRTTVQSALDGATRAENDAQRIMDGAKGDVTLYSEAQARAMSIRHRALAYNELGSAVGSLRAMAHVIDALEDPPNTKLAVDFGPNKDKAEARVAKAGLDASKHKLVYGPNKHYHLEMDTDEIVPFFEKSKEQIKQDEMVNAIKRHEANDGTQAEGMKSKWGWNPATKGFSDEIANAQEAGYRFAKEKDKCLLDFGAGIGKTYITANLIADAVQGGAKKILVVVPANLKEQTAEDGYKKFCPDDVADMVKWAPDTMSADKRRGMYAEDGVHVISHNALQNDAEWLQKQGFDAVMVDEVHQLINAKENAKPGEVTGSASFKSLEKIANNTKRVIAMTGTPIKTDKSEVFKIGSLLGAEESLGNLKEFTKRHKDINQTTNAFGASETDSIRKELATFSYSQSYKLDVDKREHNISVKSSNAQRAEYKKIMSQYKADTDAGKLGASGTRDAQLWRAAHLAGGVENSKYKALTEHMKARDPSEKSMVFFSQGPTREGAQTYAKQLNQTFGDGYAVHVDSGVKKKLINEYKAAINGDPEMVKKYPNLRTIVATDSLATGHNIQGATTIYKVDTPQSKAQDDQQSARSYRNGQSHDVDVVYFEGDDPNDINKRYNFRKKGRESSLMGNPSDVTTKDDSGLSYYLRSAEKDMTGGSSEDRKEVA